MTVKTTPRITAIVITEEETVSESPLHGLVGWLSWCENGACNRFRSWSRRGRRKFGFSSWPGLRRRKSSIENMDETILCKSTGGIIVRCTHEHNIIVNGNRRFLHIDICFSIGRHKFFHLRPFQCRRWIDGPKEIHQTPTPTLNQPN